MYSGVPLVPFILAAYIMTNKDRSGLGTGGWAIFRLEFILQNIPALTTRKEQSCEKSTRVAYGDVPSNTYGHRVCHNGQGAFKLPVCWALQRSGPGMKIRWSDQMMRSGFDEREDTTKAAWRRRETPITGGITTNNSNLLPTAISTVGFKSGHDFGMPGYLSVRISIPLSWMAAASVDGAQSSVVCAEDRRHL